MEPCTCLISHVADKKKEEEEEEELKKKKKKKSKELKKGTKKRMMHWRSKEEEKGPVVVVVVVPLYQTSFLLVEAKSQEWDIFDTNMLFHFCSLFVNISFSYNLISSFKH